jgi:hypothetical protein
VAAGAMVNATMSYIMVCPLPTTSYHSFLEVGEQGGKLTSVDTKYGKKTCISQISSV